MPPPAWVLSAPDSFLTSTGPVVEAGQSDFPLVDQQVRVSTTVATYTRYAQRLMSAADVEGAAQISIVIDPEHEHVLLHQIRVLRDGKPIDKLPEARRSLLNREQRLDAGLIDGRVTLHLLLRDIRVGDVLDYSYTTERRDPIGERGFNQWYGTRWAVPVRYMRLRVLRELDRALYIKDEGGLGQPMEIKRGDWHESLWEGRDITALLEESGRPRWHIRYPRIELSEFASWDAVRDWALPFYAENTREDPALAALLAQLRQQPDEKSRIVAALRFVQDDIRYTGIEIGAGAWRPSPPAVVLARRYGDCKDKVRLLVALLHGLGVNAWPALVSSRMGPGLLQRQPSPGAFDHVIAKVRSDGRDYWLDATTSSQGGKLGSLVQADFGPALVLQRGVDGLAEIPPRTGEKASSKVREIYDFSAGTHKTATLNVRTLYYDEDADAMRARLLTSTLSKLSQDYLDYYRKKYIGIRAAAALDIKDDREGNELAINESYEIDQPFKQDTDGKRTFGIEAYLISELTGPPAETLRTSPLARTYPRHVVQEIVVLLPMGWKVKGDRIDIDDPAFQYRSRASFVDGKMELTYDLRSLRDHVPVPQMKQFLESLTRAHDDAFYTLTDDPAPGSVAAAANRGLPGPSIEMITTLLLALGIGVVVVLGVRRLPWRLPAAEPYAPEGLGGWMIPPIIGITLSPLIVLRTIWTFFHEIDSSSLFQSILLSVRYLLLFELLLLGILLIVTCYGAWSLFTRRTTFPFTFILIHVLSLMALGFDTAALVAMGDAVSGQLLANERSLGLRIVVSGIWVSYMLVSQRVRATFVNAGAAGADYHSQRVPRVLGEPAA